MRNLYCIYLKFDSGHPDIPSKEELILTVRYHELTFNASDSRFEGDINEFVSKLIDFDHSDRNYRELGHFFSDWGCYGRKFKITHGGCYGETCKNMSVIK